MPEPLAKLGPVALTPAKLEQQLRGQAIDYEPVFMDAFNQVSIGRDVVVLEGGRSWREGYIAGLPPKLVVEKTASQVLLVLKYDDTLLVDRALAAQDYFGQSLAGVVLNKIQVGSKPCRSVSQGVGLASCLPKTAWPPT